MRFQTVISVIAVALLALTAANANAQNLVTNGSFESQIVASSSDQYSAGDTRLTGWTIGGGGIDHISTFWQPAQGAQSIDLSALSAGFISQSFATVPGRQYAITFAMAGNPSDNPDTKSMTVAFGTTTFPTQSFSTAGRSGSDMGWDTRTLFATATTASTTLTFTSLNNQANGAALDNVSVVAVTVPEAGTFALLAPMLLGAVAVITRRRKAA